VSNVGSLTEVQTNNLSNTSLRIYQIFWCFCVPYIYDYVFKVCSSFAVTLYLHADICLLLLEIIALRHVLGNVGIHGLKIGTLVERKH
jgi:hypothetical protein